MDSSWGLENLMYEEEEVASLDKKIREVKVISYWEELEYNRKNALRPFCKISPEIIQEIFLFLSHDSDLLLGKPRSDPWCDEELSYWGSKSDASARWDWLVVTWVCQYWREVAINSPRLWTFINNFKSIGRIEAFLERSRKLNLIVHLGHQDSDRPQRISRNRITIGSISLVNDHIHRVSELSLDEDRFFDDSEWDEFERLFTFESLPHLRRLCIRTNDPVADIIQTPDHHTPAMQLEALSLSGVALHWNHHILRGLTELSLEHIRVSVQPSLVKLLDILDCCQNLRILKITDAISTNDSNGTRTVHLNSLQYIEVGAIDLDMHVALFQSLNYPSSALWNISISGYPFEDATSLFLNTELEQGHDHVTVTVKDRRRIYFQSVGMDCNSPFQLSLLFEGESGDAFRCVKTILDTKFWANAESTDFTGTVALRGDFVYPNSSRVTKEAWEQFLTGIHRFKRLTLDFSNHRHLLEICLSILLEPLSHSSFISEQKSRRSSFRCPYLEDLTIVSIDFRPGSSADALYNGTYTLEKLATDLQFRSQHGVRLKKLRFIRCDGVFDKNFDLFRELNVCDETIRVDSA